MAPPRTLGHVFLFLPLLPLVWAFSPEQCELAKFVNPARAFILTDMSNEPDDQMSLVRLLTHANEIDIQGIAAVTSTWLNSTTDEPTIREVISAYGNVAANLTANVPAEAPYPSAEDLLSRVWTGHSVYGLAALDLAPSNASLALVDAVDASNDTLWVLGWGGVNVLAEALNHVSETRGEDDVACFVDKLRVYSISDQDNAGAWIRERYPQLFYIVSLHGFSEYTLATWNGISGELFRHFDKGGPDSSLVTNEWLDEHVRFGDLGGRLKASMFPLIPNGLGDPSHPEWGSWGGRYILADSSGRTRVYSDASDFVVGMSGDTYFSMFASIWRWRKGYQYDFAARMRWTIEGDASKTNHHPVAIINETCGPEALELEYTFGESVVLDASASWDPDADELTYDWLHYREVVQRLEGSIDPVSKNVTITPVDVGGRGSIVSVTPNDNITMHLILSVEDIRPDNDLTLISYRRVILRPVA